MSYNEAKIKYANMGIDTEKAIETLMGVPVALHCWQGDDVGGFDQKEAALSGGIQATIRVLPSWQRLSGPHLR